MAYTTRQIAGQFMRQFGEETGMLVYRRHGRGPAYRVSEQQAQDFLDRYVRHTRIARLVLFFATVALGGGGALLLAGMEHVPGEGTIVAWAMGLVVVLVGVFVGAEMRNQTRPARDLAVTAPVSSEIDSGEWARAQLEAVPWVNFVILPAMGLFIVWAFRDDLDPFNGWGRAIWLLPVVMTSLAATQAVRKWRAIARR